MIDARKHTLDSVKKLTDYSDFNLYKNGYMLRLQH